MHNKIAIFAIIFLTLVILGSGSILLFNKMFLSRYQARGVSPDFYMENAIYTQYDEDGSIHSQIHTPKVTHYTRDDFYSFNTPVIRVIDNKNRDTWEITAAHGESRKEGSILILVGQVKIERKGTRDGDEMIITTDHLSFYPHSRIAETDAPVSVAEGKSTMQGVGAVANLKEGSFKILSQVAGKYVED
jgi:lipopolysaccharide export system protein LptC